MNFHLVDWLIFVGLFLGLNLVAFFCRKLVKGVADFLVAGRNVGRYLGLECDSLMGLGAITILAMWQMVYKSGFVGQLWYLLTPLAAAVVALTGWGIYRFRLTRAMTLGQFVEMRYNRSTRILFGLLAYFAGVLNMGIFPITGAGFFVYYCGLPEYLHFTGLQIPTTLLLMIIMGASAVVICFCGGQVTLVITNFIQAVFINVMLVVMMISIYRMFTWEQFATAFQSAPNAEALLQPFRGQGAEGFDKRFFLIGVFWMIYWVVSWQPNTMVTSSARDAHEAKMMRVMVEIKKLIYMGLGIGMLPLAAFVLMHHPDFSAQAERVNQTLGTVTNQWFKSQMLTPAALTHILPSGWFGAFAVVVLFAFISTHTSYLLAWGSILIQDVVIPLKGNRLQPKQHLLLIKLSVLIVAVFTTIFSASFKQVDDLYNFMDITGSLYLSSSGVVLLAGLYWSRGTVPAAWAAMITGGALCLAGFITRSFYPQFLQGRIMAFYVTLISIAVYVALSYLTKPAGVDLNQILNRSKDRPAKRRWLQWDPEVPRTDRILIPCIYAAIALFAAGFAAAWIYNSLVEIPTEKWLKFWHVYIYTFFCCGTAFLIWVLIGGCRDLLRLFASLRTEVVDETDDGSVRRTHKSTRA
jgi:SSS family solute:Na+ symporter